MKTLTKQLLILSLVLMAGIGCSKKETKVADDSPAPATGSTGDNGNNGGNQSPTLGGATASLQVVSIDRLEQYAGRRINSPTNIRVNLDVFDVSDTDNRFGGTLKILYEESGRTVTGTFNSGTSEYDTRYNKWVNTGGKDKFKAMFQDNLGALVIVIEDGDNDLGTFKGKVYFRNFDFSVCSNPPPWMPPTCNVQSPQKCWNITLGPYDCRSFMSNGNMRPDIVDLPGFGSRPDGYTGPGYLELGSFDSLDVQAALNLN